ncbi:MAG: amino acid ABC transporter permease [Thermoflexales bacterium]|nr:amino acid ABC transporter permease [Thermoflexales bacterium]MDW8352668.1 amino acid ABC transporter permease [Anaerolineae bacterium]
MSLTTGPRQPAAIPLDSTADRSAQGRFVDRLSQWPWWLLIIVFFGVLIVWNVMTSELYSAIFSRLLLGIGITIFTTLVAYGLAIVIGLVAGLGRVSHNPIIFNIATLYVQVIRGVPILVQLLVIAFVIVPIVIDAVNWLGNVLAPLLGAENFLARTQPQDVPFLTRCIIALAIAYGGFQAETFRAGIQSISKGQMEAARSLGMSYLQAMRYVILPQAIRRVLPPLGNDFIAMLKDSSLVSVLGVRDITQEARLYASASFRFLETYTSLAFLYLAMTIVLSLGVKWLENRLNNEGRGQG